MATEQYDQAPRAIRESLIFPYFQGSIWATQVYKRGGWSMVSDAFKRLPLSTEQILHPEKYFKYERPVKVVLPDVSNLLNAGKQQTVNSNQHESGSSEQSALGSQQNTGTAGVSPASSNKTRKRRTTRALPTAHRTQPTGSRPLPTSAWRRIEYDVNGEWSYYLILDQFLKSPAESKRATAGWAGDRYALYQGPNGQLFLAQVTVWDTETTRKNFSRPT